MKAPIVILTIVAVLILSFIAFRKTEVGNSESSPKLENTESTAATTIEPASQSLSAAPKQAPHAKPESPKEPKPTPGYARAAAPVPSEVFDKMVTKPDGALAMPIYLAHERFSRETVDANWSTNVIRAVSRSPELNSLSITAFQQQQLNMQREAWWSGYGLADQLSKIAIAPDGRAVMIGYVHTAVKP